MPICPGCESVVPYDQLPTHLRLCVGLDDSSRAESEKLETLANEIARTNDRLTRRVRRLETAVDRQLVETGRREQYRS